MSKRHAWIASSILSGLSIGGCTESPNTMAVVPAAQAEVLHEVVRVKADKPRARRWELGWGAAYAYDAANGHFIRRAPLAGASMSGATDTCRPDLIVSRSGAVIVSSNAEPVLWRIDPASFEVRRYDIVPDVDRDKDFGFSALAWSAGETTLYAASAIMGTLWRIDLESGRATKIALTTPIRGACGLAAREGTAGSTTLTVAGRGGASPWRVTLSGDGTRGEVAAPGDRPVSPLR